MTMYHKSVGYLDAFALALLTNMTINCMYTVVRIGSLAPFCIGYKPVIIQSKALGLNISSTSLPDDFQRQGSFSLCQFG